MQSSFVWYFNSPELLLFLDFLLLEFFLTCERSQITHNLKRFWFSNWSKFPVKNYSFLSFVIRVNFSPVFTFSLNYSIIFFNDDKLNKKNLKFRCIREKYRLADRLPIQCLSSKDRAETFSINCCSTDFCNNDNVGLRIKGTFDFTLNWWKTSKQFLKYI
jgi:hypothetical protein